MVDDYKPPPSGGSTSPPSWKGDTTLSALQRGMCLGVRYVDAVDVLDGLPIEAPVVKLGCGQAFMAGDSGSIDERAAVHPEESDSGRSE